MTAARRGTLFLVGTPIGNVGDMSERARETLTAVDVVAAEDTRRTGSLLARLGVKGRRMVSLFEGNERERTEELLRALRAGSDVAVVSDAGMPGLSDPGYRLVAGCVEAGIEVRVVPGPSAVVTALVVSGLPTDRFSFEGFLPRRAGERSSRLGELAGDPRTLVLFESPRRVVATLREIRERLGDRRIAVARELTKLHEEVLRGTVGQVLERIEGRQVRGEVVIVLEGASGAPTVSMERLVAEAEELTAGGMRKRAAAAEVARRHRASANHIYSALIDRTPER